MAYGFRDDVYFFLKIRQALLAFFAAGPRSHAIAGLLLLSVWIRFTAWINPYVTPLEPADRLRHDPALERAGLPSPWPARGIPLIIPPRLSRQGLST